jgi:hypothetical protein
MISTDVLVSQLHRALVDALVLSERHNLHEPVTVAEIYTDLIPYRSVRMIGFAMNADYEHALMQLLAGEGGYAQVEPVEVRDHLREELKSSNPNTGIYRHYAACDVVVTLPEGMDFTEAGTTSESRTQEEAIAAAPAVAPVHTAPFEEREPAVEAEAASAPGKVEEEPMKAEPTLSADAATATWVDRLAAHESKPVITSPDPAPPPNVAHCVECDRELPAGRIARFCPFCGVDQTVRKCKSCKEKIETGWKFCIACGTPTG